MRQGPSFLALCALLTLAPAALAEELRIGLVSTRAGGGAVIGAQLENGFRLGLAAHGWKSDGDQFVSTPTRLYVVDDQMKPDVGLREVERLLKQDRVHIVTGLIWSNVFAVVAGPVLTSNRLLVGSVAGLSQFAGERCSPLFVSTSHQNDQNGEAMGMLLSKQNIKSVVFMAPAYQAGREFLSAFEAAYKGGKITDKVLFKLGESDFQPEFSKVAARPSEAVVVFAPGAMGISFLRQWQASGLREKVKLFSIYTIDGSNIAAIGEAAIGTNDTHSWSPDLPNEINRRFVKDYFAVYGSPPAFYAMYAYDSAQAIALGLRKTRGKFDDAAAMARAIRTSAIDSPRGSLKFNANGFLIQPYYHREVQRSSSGTLTFKTIEKIMERPDSFLSKCPAEKRVQG